MNASALLNTNFYSTTRLYEDKKKFHIVLPWKNSSLLLWFRISDS